MSNRGRFSVPGLAGHVFHVGDTGWDDSRRPWKLHVDQQPAVVAVPGSSSDIPAIVQAAGAAGLRVTAQSTGHNAVPLGSLTETVLIRTQALDHVRIDGDRRIARMGSGVRWGSVVAPAADHGLAALTGTSRGVGVAGYLLGGGIGWLTRSHGLGCLSLRAAELVLADGSLIRVDEHHDPDLLWALRGGGGGFGIVTAFEVDLYPVPAVYGGLLAWPIEHARSVLELWRRWSLELPDSATTVGRLLRIPPSGEFPTQLAGRDLVVVEGAFQMDDIDADRLLAPLRELAPEFDTFRQMRIPELADLHMDPQEPFPSPGSSVLIRELARDALESFVDAALDPANESLRSIEIRVLGGACRPTRPDFAAVSGFDADAILFAVGPAPDGDAVERVREALGRLLTSVHQFSSDVGYLNFLEDVSTPEHVFGPALPRLTEIKHRVDPDDRIQANHPVLARPVPI